MRYYFCLCGVDILGFLFGLVWGSVGFCWGVCVFSISKSVVSLVLESFRVG